MNDLLLYNPLIEDSIELFNETPDELEELPSYIAYDGHLNKKGKQGLVGYLLEKNTNNRYVYKISQYLDYVISQEYNVLKDLNTIRDYCPHFVKVFKKIHLPVTANYTKTSDPFELSEEYKSVKTDVMIMENLENCKKFYKYIKNKESPVSTTKLLSIIKQTLLAIEIAFKKVNFTHYDLHSDNILIKPCEKNSVFLYIIDGEYHLVPTYGMYPVIIDFGFSYSKEADQKQMNCSLGHTDSGFMQYKEDRFADCKILLSSVSYELKHYKKDEKSQIFRNIVKNLYKHSDIDLDCGWDNGEININNEFTECFEKTFSKSDFFKRQSDYIIDLLQTLIILPIKYRKTKESTKELLSLVINEYKKIENSISDDFYNLFILKEIVSSVNKHRNLYTSDSRNEAVANFKSDVLKAIDRVAKFCNPKINWEKLLCTLLLLGKNIENFCHERLVAINKIKDKNNSKIRLQTNLEIYKCIEANIPSYFRFNRDTILYTWNYDTENSLKSKLDEKLIELLNDTHPFERGDLMKEYNSKLS
jgi:hypothetical protein